MQLWGLEGLNLVRNYEVPVLDMRLDMWGPLSLPGGPGGEEWAVAASWFQHLFGLMNTFWK